MPFTAKVYPFKPSSRMFRVGHKDPSKRETLTNAGNPAKTLFGLEAFHCGYPRFDGWAYYRYVKATTALCALF